MNSSNSLISPVSPLSSRLGTGTYANVTSLGCYAVKTTKEPVIGKDGGIMDISYLREWSALKALNGLPGVVECLSFSHRDHSMLLQRYSKDADSTTGLDTFEITVGILRGLDSLYRRAIIHRDIKPANILVSGNHGVICDFGLARYMYAESCDMTSRVYSEWWRPPELLLESNISTYYDKTADIWGAGMTILDICLGSSLNQDHPGANILEVLENVNSTKIENTKLWNTHGVKIRELRQSYSNNLSIPSLSSLETYGTIEPAISNVIRSMISWDPSERLNPSELLSLLSISVENNYKSSWIEYMKSYDRSIPRQPVDLNARNIEIQYILNTCFRSIDISEMIIYAFDTCLLKGILCSRDLTEICIWLISRLMNGAAYCYCPNSLDLMYKVLDVIGTGYNVVPSVCGHTRGNLIFGYYLQNTI
jgi:serine/threonine protein kinase